MTFNNDHNDAFTPMENSIDNEKIIEKKNGKEETIRLQVHDCKFFQWIPSGILSFSVCPVKDLLAVGKINGDIEIWNLSSGFFQEREIKGNGSPVKSLAWASQRLFSAGLNGKIIEWDFNQLREKFVEDSYGGAIWSIAVNPDETLIAAACDDGCVRLFDISEGLRYSKSFQIQKGRMLAVAWHPKGKAIFSSSSNATVYRWDLDGTLVNFTKVKLESSKRKIIIWCISVLNDFTVIAGDSLGSTNFIDGEIGVVLETHSLHKADVLAIATSPNGNSVYTSGIDHKVLVFVRVEDRGIQKWILSANQRLHSHDIRALAIFKDILLSGGNDCQLGIYPLSTFGDRSTLKRIYPYSNRSLVSLSKSKKLLLFQYDTKLELWKIGQASLDESLENKNNGEILPVEEMATFLLDLKPKINNIVCSSLSPDGLYVACSDQKSVHLFKLIYSKKGILVKRIHLPSKIESATKLLFTNDSSMLIIATNNSTIHILNLENNQILQTITTNINEDTSYFICTLAISNDDKWLASGDLNNFIHIYDLSSFKVVQIFF